MGEVVLVITGITLIACGVLIFPVWRKIIRPRFASLLLIEISAFFMLTGLTIILGIFFSSSPQPIDDFIDHLLLFDLLSMIATMVIWPIYNMLKLDTADINYSDESEGKHKNDEKRKRQPTYWEPTKKKRSIPPDQGGVG